MREPNDNMKRLGRSFGYTEGGPLFELNHSYGDAYAYVVSFEIKAPRLSTHTHCELRIV